MVREIVRLEVNTHREGADELINCAFGLGDKYRPIVVPKSNGGHRLVAPNGDVYHGQGSITQMLNRIGDSE
jgi:hypothetical protein